MSYYDAAYSTRETLDLTKYYAHQVMRKRVPGAFVECGVAAGAQLAAMQTACVERQEFRWIYGFDSFQGIPLASDEDDEQPGIGPKADIQYTDKRELLKSSGITVHSKASVQNNMRTWLPKSDNIVLVKGWFQDTVPEYVRVFKMLGGISLLRLDGDLYDSTKVCLEYLFPLLNSGGILIIDDWELTGCRRACEEYFATHPVVQLTSDYGPRYFMKGVPDEQDAY